MSTAVPLPSSLEIAQAARLRPIGEIAGALGLADDEWEPYGRHKAKLSADLLGRLHDVPDGKLVAVTAVTPTRAGEGKTTTAVALTDGLGAIGERAVLCLREPSLGPVFGIKGGGTGGGHAQVVPMEDINLHFTGDIHAIGAANNLLAAMIDAHVLHGNELEIDPLTVSWRRCVDMDDRGLRHVMTGLGGRNNGAPRETGFDITAASEVMAILAVSRDAADLRRRLGAITVARSRSGEPVTAEELRAAGAMAVLLHDALRPNLVQTLEGQPALVHCGPFANIAHGNSSLLADLIGLKLADYVVTEGGFGSDMGFEKFCDIVCRAGEIRPAAVVLVATVQALRSHGDGDIEAGGDNLARHLAIVRELGIDPVVAVNRFPGDCDDDAHAVREVALRLGARAAVVCEGYERGGAGAAALARAVVEAAADPPAFRPLYSLSARLSEKLEAIATRIYGADGIELAPAASAAVDLLEREGLGELPVCVAKTPASLSHDPALGPTPSGFTLPVRDVRAYTGAGWVVALCGDVMTMPGLGAEPAALGMDVGENGRILGLH